jgi:hypothetical protein
VPRTIGGMAVSLSTGMSWSVKDIGFLSPATAGTIAFED